MTSKQLTGAARTRMIRGGARRAIVEIQRLLDDRRVVIEEVAVAVAGSREILRVEDASVIVQQFATGRETMVITFTVLRKARSRAQ